MTSVYGAMFAPDHRRAANELANLGPLTQAFANLEAERRRAFADELIALATAYNTADDGTVVIPTEHLEIVLRKR